MLALSICALLLLFPAFTLPLFSIHILGLTEDTNLLHGALMMLNSAPLVAFMVLFCAVVAPTLLIISIVISSTCFTFNLRFVFLPQILKVTRILSHWSMLEVYLVSLIVAIFKLIAYADLYFGLGFYFFIALLWINMLILSNYSDHHSWEKYYNE
ncbi:paraquat-inducible protein A [Psychromonas sp. CD1]|uniref:paraquat-inducible protein A n=1 Tax=Psychromonas sp. CD1 TaxID=1979839 RepID=UPI000B9A3CAD|nr:paraquat-inducible protein A [Psychromonas sp. CD1]